MADAIPAILVIFFANSNTAITKVATYATVAECEDAGKTWVGDKDWTRGYECIVAPGNYEYRQSIPEQARQLQETIKRIDQMKAENDRRRKELQK